MSASTSRAEFFLPSASPLDVPDAHPRAWLGYNGQLHEPGQGGRAGWQFLGNGYRVYNPALMRFHSPDSLSPFGERGINAYAYCAGDPINHADPSGHFLLPVAALNGLAALVGVGALGAAGMAVAKGISGDKEAAVGWGILAGALAGVAAMGGGLSKMMERHLRQELRKRSPYLDEGSIRFFKGRNWDVVNVHGVPNGSVVGSQALDGSELAKLVTSRGMGKRKIELLSCDSATGVASQGQVLADATGQKVKAYHGIVYPNRYNRPGSGALAEVFRPQPITLRMGTAIRNIALNREALPRHPGWQHFALPYGRS